MFQSSMHGGAQTSATRGASTDHLVYLPFAAAMLLLDNTATGGVIPSLHAKSSSLGPRPDTVHVHSIGRQSRYRPFCGGQQAAVEISEPCSSCPHPDRQSL